MITAPLIGILAAALAADSEPPLAAAWLYNPVNRPLIIEVRSLRSFGMVTLALMDAEGTALADPITVHPGRIDLAESLPGIWRLPGAAYLQMLIAETPIGSALVLEPMLSRLVPITRDATSPDGIRYTEIVGWRDELHPVEEEIPAAKGEGPAEPQATADDAPGETARPPVRVLPDHPAPRLCTGLRIYSERDVILHTTAGDIRLAMRPDHAPNTVFNFLSLCEGGFYRDIAFHRIVPYTRLGEPFVIQAGDPTATGGGGPGYWLPMEKSHLPHDFGVISMARDADPDSAGSQFFICLSREGTARLDGHYCAFGYTVDGAKTILDLAQVELADVAAGRPADPPVIRSAELVDAPPRTPGVGRPDRPATPELDEPDQPADRPPRRVPR